MSSFVFKNIKGEVFTVNGPEGMTSEQAEAIWRQQSDTGSLTGLSVGKTLSAATQAAAGLPGAAAMLSQAQGTLSGFLPKGTNLGSITSLLGPGGAAAGGQISSALAGGQAAFNSLTTAASAATGSISKALSGAGGGAGLNLPSMPSLTGVSGALTGAAGQIGSFANQAVNTVSKALSGAVSNPINISDFAKQAPALSGIEGMKLPDVTGAMASASKLVGQGFDKISNSLGAGKFGFDANQLEKAGLVKPGTAAAFLAQGDNDLVSVLKSPKVWTGKDGAKGLDSLLSNPGLQDKVQQGLMKSGLDGLKQAGVPVGNMTPQALAGVANNAAKSVSDTLAWMKGGASVPSVPGAAGLAGAASAAAGSLAGGAAALSAGVKSAFDASASAGAFAVNFTQTKVEPPFLKETKPEPASDTANTATVDAAATRVVGNEKVPSVAASGGSSADAKTKVRAFIDLIDSGYASLKSLVPTIEQYEQASSITQEQWNQLNGELQTVRATINTRSVPLQEAAIAAIDELPSSSKAVIADAFQTAQQAGKTFASYAKDIVKRIKDLANKIAT